MLCRLAFLESDCRSRIRHWHGRRRPRSQEAAANDASTWLERPACIERHAVRLVLLGSKRRPRDHRSDLLGGRSVSGILGIDPGLSGALALWHGGQWWLLDMPIAGDAKRRELNGPILCSWLRERALDHAFVEYAAARPGQGVSSTFKFGVSYGATKMALAACNVPYTTVTPAKWKPAVGIQTGADKEMSRLRALQLFPDLAAYLSRKRDHARADAMLLAYFGMKAGAL
jgi:crossover junction endodeoxyribonuclease RuvC